MDNRMITIETLEQIAVSDEDAIRFADDIECRALIRAPRDLKPSVMQKTVPVFRYRLRVCTAAAAALALLITLPGLQVFSPRLMPGHSPSRYFYEKAEQLNFRLNSFSNQLLNLEVWFND